MKTIRELIQVTSRYLEEKGIDSPRLNAERLLGHVLSLTRIELYFQHDRPVTTEEMDRYREYVRARAAGQPLQTLIQETEFYSRGFKVAPGVFIPRPETEILVESCVRLLTPPDRRPLAPQAVEIGTGCGVIGISLAAEIPSLQVFGTDVNSEAIRLSMHNAKLNGVAARFTCLQGELYEPLPAQLRGQVDLLVSNPPYVREDEMASLPVEVAEHDPREALDGGPDGLTFYRVLAAGFSRWLRPGAVVAMEIGCELADAVIQIFRNSGCDQVAVVNDYNDLPRVVTAIYAPASAVDGPAVSRQPASGPKE